jgi:ketosteroid isomerase-like protein
MPVGIEENKRVVLEFLDRQYAHRIPEAFELVADDATWWMPGELPVSGTYTKAQIQAVFEGVLDRFVAAPDMTIRAVTAEEDRVAVEVTGIGEMRSGLDFHNTYHMLFRVRDGLITSCHNHQDLDHLRRITEAELDQGVTATDG